jgi:hypothetical protein
MFKTGRSNQTRPDYPCSVLWPFLVEGPFFSGAANGAPNRERWRSGSELRLASRERAGKSSSLFGVFLLDRGFSQVPHVSGCSEPLHERRYRSIWIGVVAHRIEDATRD